MAKLNVDVWIGNTAFSLAIVIIVVGFLLSLIFGGLLMYEYNNPVTGAIAALCIVLLYVLFLVIGICSIRGAGWWWWSLTKAMVSFTVLIALTPEVVKILGTSIERFQGSLNTSFYLVKDTLYGITVLVLLLPVVGVIFKVRRALKRKRPSTS
ncbi:MAG: hypothetical protein ACYTFE_00635 [Planctomycetota bacterium]|jgi:hypothetical protein